MLIVTFTNAAAAEMKERILSQLYGISHSLPDSNPYLNYIKDNLDEKLSEEEIKARAKTALLLLLHGYQFFRVETIDSFFQSILRGLSHELNLTANMQVDLDQGELLAKAVQRVLTNAPVTDPDARQWIVSFIMEKIDTGKSWNITKDLTSFGNNIFKDDYINHELSIREAINEGAVKRLKAYIYKRKEEINDRLDGISAAFFSNVISANFTVKV